MSFVFAQYNNEWKTLKVDNIRVNKKEFHKPKQPIHLDLVNLDQIVISDKFKHNDDSFKYFIGHKEGEVVKPLIIILHQMSGYKKHFENGGKSMSFVIKDDDVLDKYSEIWDKIKTDLNIKSHSMSVYDKKYIKPKVRELNGAIKTNFLGDQIPKESLHYACIACITIDSLMRMEKLSISLFRRVQIHIKEHKNAQIYKRWIRVRIRVRVRIWDWIRIKVGVRIWHWIIVMFLLTLIYFKP